jgi:hypothetical protein
VNNVAIKQKKVPATVQALDEFIREKGDWCKMPGPASLTEDVAMPPEFVAAFVTGRPELVKLVRPRALTEEECKSLYNAMAVLIQTNAALIEHAQRLATSVDQWDNAFKQLDSVGRRIVDFANFRSPLESDDEEKNS